MFCDVVKKPMVKELVLMKNVFIGLHDYIYIFFLKHSRVQHSMFWVHSGSVSRTTAGKRSPPSPRREYMSLRTLGFGLPEPGHTDER